MKICIFGGTGAMGTHLTRLLASAKHDVYVTSRAKRQNGENVSFIQGNAHDDAFLAELLKEKFDCIVDFMAYTTEEFKKRANALLSSCGHYVFLSTSRVYADSDSPITENSPRLLDVCGDKEFLATDEYALAKARSENILADTGGGYWTIVRPYITYSERRLQLGVMEKEEWLWLALNKNAIGFSKDIARRTTTLSYGYDVARGIAALLGQKEAFGEAFHITGTGCEIKWADVLKLYRKVLAGNGIKPAIHMREKCYRLNNPMAKYQVIYDRYYDRVFDNSKISRFIDTAAFAKPRAGLEKCLTEFLKSPCFDYPCGTAGIDDATKNHKGRIPLLKISGIKQKAKRTLVALGLRK